MTNQDDAKILEPEDNIPEKGIIPLPEGIDLVKFIQNVYDLSKPQGLGKMHFTPEPLNEAEAEQILKRYDNHTNIVLALDYLNGRACKMTVWKSNQDVLYIRDNWFDHEFKEFKELLKRCKIKILHAQPNEHEDRVKEQREANPFSTVAGEDDE